MQSRAYWVYRPRHQFCDYLHYFSALGFGSVRSGMGMIACRIVPSVNCRDSGHTYTHARAHARTHTQNLMLLTFNRGCVFGECNYEPNIYRPHHLTHMACHLLLEDFLRLCTTVARKSYILTATIKT